MIISIGLTAVPAPSPREKRPDPARTEAGPAIIVPAVPPENAVGSSRSSLKAGTFSPRPRADIARLDPVGSLGGVGKAVAFGGPAERKLLPVELLDGTLPRNRRLLAMYVPTTGSPASRMAGTSTEADLPFAAADPVREDGRADAGRAGGRALNAEPDILSLLAAAARSEGRLARCLGGVERVRLDGVPSGGANGEITAIEVAAALVVDRPSAADRLTVRASRL
mmetsp:Transcript_31280/g.95655  ORF Transcript_31280/g.95655 Transcript_31280/m.95655 type:complete len:224 (+) Transcript_31280:327-998(+)